MKFYVFFSPSGGDNELNYTLLEIYFAVYE